MVICKFSFMLAIIQFSVCCISVSQVKFEEDREAATFATREFHNLFNESRFEEIYAMTDIRARETKRKDGLISILTALRNERGRVVGSALIDMRIERVRHIAKLFFRSKQSLKIPKEMNDSYGMYQTNMPVCFRMSRIS